MSVGKAPRQGVISLALKDKAELYAAYVPYVKNGGVFYRTNRPYELGDEVFLLLTLMDDPERHPVAGKVVWLSQKSTGGRPVGVGIQFTGDNSADVQKKIDTLLAGSHNSARSTFTM